MKKKITNNVHEKFSYDEKTKTSKCRICDKILQGKHATNLLKHLSSVHENEYNEVSEANAKKAKLDTTNKTPDLSKYLLVEKETIQIKMTASKLQAALVEMVTKNCRPLSAVEDSGFRKIIDPILNGFSSENKISVNRFNMRKLITEEAENIRRRISKIVEKKLISIKIDCASKMDRAILGVNVQILQENQIKIFTLAMAEIKTRSTSENLHLILKNVFERYKINQQQIYTMTTDNGSNMIKCTNLILKEQCENDNNILEDDDSEEFDFDFGVEDEDLLANIDFENSGLVATVRCVAHTFQLSVKKFTDAKNVDKLIQKARTVTKKLRTPTFIAIIKKQKLRKPLVDCPTRWSSTFLMLERLKTLKEFCDIMEEKVIVISDSDWREIDKILEALKPAHTTNKLLQTEQFTLSDIYCAWTKCKIDLTKINNTYSKILLDSMIQREDYLMSNPMVACLYLDRRYKVMLTENQKEQAKNHLLNIYIHKTRLLNRDRDIPEIENNLNLLPAAADITVFDNEDELEIILARKEKEKGQSNIINSNMLNNKETPTNHIKSILDSFDNTSRIPLNTNILEYWSNQKNVLPSHLYELSQIIFAVPGTQVSVERAFSSFNYIYSDKRNSICDKLLEDILLIKLNKF